MPNSYLPKEVINAYGVFSDYSPHENNSKEFCLKRWQGIIPTFRRYSLEGLIMGKSSRLEDTLVEYRIGRKKEGGIQVLIFTVADFWKFKNGEIHDETDERSKFDKSNVIGFLKEQIAWNTTYY